MPSLFDRWASLACSNSSNALYKKDYNFTIVLRESLGEVRCVVIDAQPKADAAPGRFAGRMWVEDQDYTVVRFNGRTRGTRRIRRMCASTAGG